MEARQGRNPVGVRCAARQRDRPSPRWPGTPRLQIRMDNRVRTSARKASWICCGCCLADPAQPGRRCSGAPSLCGGDSPQGFPLEASEVRSATGAKVSTPGAAKRKVRRPRRDDAPKAARRDQLAAGAVIDCNWSITPGSTNTQACLSSIGTLNTWANTVRRRCASRPVRYACSGFMRPPACEPLRCGSHSTSATKPSSDSF